MLGDHLAVHDKAARGQDRGAGPHHAAAVVGTPPHPADPARLDDQLGGPGLEPDLHTELPGTPHQQVDDQLRAAGVAGHGHLVAARRGNRKVAERPDLLVAGVHQALGLRLDDRLVRVVAALELKTQALQPVAVLRAAVGIGPDLAGLRLRGDRHQVGVHLIRGVLVTGGALHHRAATEVEMPAGHRTGAARHRGPLQHQHRRPRRRRLDRRAPARDAEPHHDHIHLAGHAVIPRPAAALSIPGHVPGPVSAARRRAQHPRSYASAPAPAARRRAQHPRSYASAPAPAARRRAQHPRSYASAPAPAARRRAQHPRSYASAPAPAAARCPAVARQLIPD